MEELTCWKAKTHELPRPPPLARGDPASCACFHDNFCCSGWNADCEACQQGRGNAFGCAPLTCPGDQKQSCTCAVDLQCCKAWDSMCQLCHEGKSNVGLAPGRACTAGACNSQSNPFIVPLFESSWSYMAVSAWSLEAAACSSGTNQSPVTLPHAAPAATGPRLPMMYEPALVEVRNTDHGLLFDIKTTRPSLWEYTLVRIHVHHHAEHVIRDDVPAEIELQLVHTAILPGEMTPSYIIVSLLVCVVCQRCASSCFCYANDACFGLWSMPWPTAYTMAYRI